MNENELTSIYLHKITKYDLRKHKAWLSKKLEMQLTDDAFIAYIMERTFKDVGLDTTNGNTN